MIHETKTVNEILLIDDDYDDCTIFELAVKEHFPTAALNCLHQSGEELTLLEGCSPDLIFLDINLIAVSGLSYLKQLKAQAGLCGIPVVVYSGSGLPKNIAEAARLGAALYFFKTHSFQDLSAALKDIISMEWYQGQGSQMCLYKDGQIISYEPNPPLLKTV